MELVPSGRRVHDLADDVDELLPAIALARQLRHLLDVMQLASVSLGVIPADIDRSSRWPVEDFYIFDSAQANVELVSGFLTITHPREIAMYAETFTALSKLAVYGSTARALIQASLADLPS